MLAAGGVDGHVERKPAVRLQDAIQLGGPGCRRFGFDESANVAA